jgi:hypothetical protein
VTTHWRRRVFRRKRRREREWLRGKERSSQPRGKPLFLHLSMDKRAGRRPARARRRRLAGRHTCTAQEEKDE